MSVDGRVAVVKRAARGIGAALARRLHADGAKVAVVDLDGPQVTATADGLPGALGIRADAADDDGLAWMLSEVAQRLRPVDLYFANAGVFDGLGLDTAEAAWDRSLDVNIRAHVRAARQLVPQWLERGEGYFVSTASVAGLLSKIGSATYTVSKHGAVAFAEWRAITCGQRGIRVSCVCPMGVDTDMLADGLDATMERREAAQAVTAVGILLTPDEVAEHVLDAIARERFLVLPHPEVLEFVRRKASDHARWIARMQRLQAAVSGVSE